MYKIAALAAALCSACSAMGGAEEAPRPSSWPAGAAANPETPPDDLSQSAPNARGDRAVTAFERRLSRIRRSKGSFAGRLAAVRKALEAATPEWNRLGDDRVLSKMRNAAGEAAGNLAKAEIERIRRGAGDQSEERRSLEALRAEVDRQDWLPEGFRSGIRLDVSFAVAQSRTGKIRAPGRPPRR